LAADCAVTAAGRDEVGEGLSCPLAEGGFKIVPSNTMTATIPRGRGIEFLNIKFLPEKMPGKYIGDLVLIGIEDNFFMCCSSTINSNYNA
jgi:hypothetical protein